MIPPPTRRSPGLGTSDSGDIISKTTGYSDLGDQGTAVVGRTRQPRPLTIAEQWRCWWLDYRPSYLLPRSVHPMPRNTDTSVPGRELAA